MVRQEAYVHGVSTRAVDDLVKGYGRNRHVQMLGQPALRGDRGEMFDKRHAAWEADMTFGDAAVLWSYLPALDRASSCHIA